MFYFCTSLKKVEFHPRQTVIKSGMFKKTAFKTFTVPDSIVSIEENAFSLCEKLEEFHFGMGITSIDPTWFVSYAYIDPSTNEIVVPQPGNENENLYQVASYAINITFYIPGGLRLDDFSWIKYFGNIDVKIDETNPYYYTKDHAIINKQTNTLLATFGNIGKKYSIPKEVEYMDANSIFTSQFTHYIDADSTLFENDKYQGTILKIPDTVKVVNSQKTNPYYDTVYCYKGRYYQNSFQTSDFAITKKYIYPKIGQTDRMRNMKCDNEDVKEVRHVIGLTKMEIGLIIGAVIVGIVLLTVIFLYIFLPLTKLIMKAAENDIAP